MNEIEALRLSIMILMQNLATLERRPTTFFGTALTNADKAWQMMLAEFAASEKPHAWREHGPGTPFGFGGDNDDSVEMDNLLRAFGPFMTLAENANLGKLPQDAVVKDSTGAPFHRIWIKKRSPLGIQAVRNLRDEIRGIWYSAWGQATRADPANANHIPKQEVWQSFFDRVY